jgi:tripartite-type tricarboxylate transporter receptor subunit TctC
MTGLAVTSAALCAPVAAQAADFYEGKNIEFVIGSAPGGGYDTYGRLMARYIDNYIPGKPTIVPKNMPGAGSGKAATYIYDVAPKDGTAIAGIFPGAIVGPLLDDRIQARAHYDPTKFAYLASADAGTRVCATMATSPIKTFEDAQKTKTTVGASQAGGSTRDYAVLLNNLAGAKFNVIAGYKGSASILLAMERLEVNGLCGFDWTSFKSQKPDWIRDKKVNVLLQVGPEPEPELTKMGVPEVWKYLKSEEDRQVVELIVAQQTFGRPYIAPPGTPKERVEMLRKAFASALKDKKLLADAEKARISIKPSSGKKVQELVAKLYKTPKSIVQRAKDAMAVGVSDSKKPSNSKKKQG